MKKSAKKILMLIIVLLFFQFSIFAFAQDDHTVAPLEAIELPPDLNFSASSTCSGHVFFMQAAANESGYFAIYSLHVDPDDLSSVDFQKVYIDIYQPDGVLLQELSFTTSQALTIKLEENCVNIIFDGSVLVYDFTTQELYHFAIPAGAVENGDTYKQLRSRNFTVGEWEYTCKKGFLGYDKLSRDNGEQEQVLIEMTGNRNYLRDIIIPGSVACGIIIIIAVIHKKRAIS